MLRLLAPSQLRDGDCPCALAGFSYPFWGIAWRMSFAGRIEKKKRMRGGGLTQGGPSSYMSDSDDSMCNAGGIYCLLLHDFGALIIRINRPDDAGG